MDYDWSKDVAAIKAPTLLVLVMPTLSARRMPCSSSNSWAAARRTALARIGNVQCPARHFARPYHYNIFSSPALASLSLRSSMSPCVELSEAVKQGLVRR